MHGTIDCSALSLWTDQHRVNESPLILNFWIFDCKPQPGMVSCPRRMLTRLLRDFAARGRMSHSWTKAVSTTAVDVDRSGESTPGQRAPLRPGRPVRGPATGPLPARKFESWLHGRVKLCIRFSTTIGLGARSISPAASPWVSPSSRAWCSTSRNTRSLAGGNCV